MCIRDSVKGSNKKHWMRTLSALMHKFNALCKTICLVIRSEIEKVFMWRWTPALQTVCFRSYLSFCRARLKTKSRSGLNDMIFQNSETRSFVVHLTPTLSFHEQAQWWCNRLVIHCCVTTNLILETSWMKTWCDFLPPRYYGSVDRK